MSNIEKASLILRTCDCTTTNTSYTSFTWSNIDLRTVLGDMYYKYDRFNLNLVNITSSEQIFTYTVGTSTTFCQGIPDNAFTIVNITGLPWVNQGYNAGVLHNTNVAVLAPFMVPLTQYTNTSTNYGKTYLIFEKNQDVSNITIYFTRVEDNLPPVTPTNFNFPNFIFQFNIFGLPKDPENMNGSRLII